MFRTDDPISDFDRYELEEFKRAEKLPTCACCEDKIYQDSAVYLNKYGAWICDRCLEDSRISVPDWEY